MRARGSSAIRIPVGSAVPDGPTAVRITRASLSAQRRRARAIPHAVALGHPGWQARRVVGERATRADGRSRPQHTLADVLPALLGALGEAQTGPEPRLDIAPASAVALLLIDGLGSELLRQYAADAPFLASLPDAGPLRTGFPSSTSISLTSLGTGLPPGAHGMVGISFRVAPGELMDSLRWTTHAGAGRSADLRERFPPETYQPEATLFQRAEAAGIAVRVVSQQIFLGSGLTRAALRGGEFRGASALGDLAAEVISGVTAGSATATTPIWIRWATCVGPGRWPGDCSWPRSTGSRR